MKYGQTIVYDICRKAVGVFMRFFYWRIRIRGFNWKRLSNRPVMFVSNHQNALMDPLFLPCYTPLRPSFLTRSDVFVPPVMDKILYTLKLLPIFRKRDGLASPRKNRVIFNKCVQLLQDKESILIFPEGSHDINRRLRPLKKGFADILFQAEEKSNWTLDSWIVPLMVNYEEHQMFGRDVVVLFGDPVPVSKYKELFKSEPAKAKKVLAKEMRQHMMKNLIQLDPVTHKETLKNLYEHSQEAVHGKIRKPYQRYLADKAFFDKLGAFVSNGGVEAKKLMEQVEEYFTLKNQLGLAGFDLSDSSSFFKMLWRIVILLIGLPIYGFGMFCNYLPYLGGKIAADRVKDPCFKSTSWFLAWMIGTLIYHSFLILIFMNSVSSKPLYVLLFWLAIVFSGRIAMAWWKLYSKLFNNFKIFSKQGDTSFQILEEMRARLKKRFAENGLLAREGA